MCRKTTKLLSGRGTLLLAALLAVAMPGLAQVNTGVIMVDTIDQDGGYMPGVTIQVVNAGTGLQRAVVTDAQGAVVVPALPPGTYSVTATLDSFATVKQEVKLLVGQTVRLKVEMQMKISEEIMVTAEAPLVDVYRTDTSTNIVPEQIQDLPVPDRDFQKLAFIAPGVQRERGGYRFIGDSPLVGSSGNASETTIMVDGVDFTDQALGLARARFSQDAIGEFRVINNRFDTEIGASSGGAVSVITKSGTNQLHGSVFGFWRDDSLRQTGELEEGTQDYSRYQIGMTLGGPITRDRTHYFVSLEYIDEDKPTLFRPQGAYVASAEDIPNPFKQTLLFAGLDHQISDQQTLQLKLMYEQYRMDNFRVGGVADESSGMELNRDNWNLTAGHTWLLADNRLNELRVQIGGKSFDEPNNSDAMAEWFTLGATLQTGANIVGDQDMDGTYLEVRDTYHLHAGSASSHDLKFGGSLSRITEKWHYPLIPRGWMFYLTDDRSAPLRYDYFDGTPDLEVSTNIAGLFVQDDWRPRSNLTLSLGLRYDYDSDGANPDFGDSGHELVGSRGADTDNFQPRVGFSWDVSGDGSSVLRGGAGLFTGRYLLVPALIEQQQNGFTGAWQIRLFIDPSDPMNTGLLLPPSITLLEDDLEAPEAVQLSLGYTQRLGDSGLYLNAEAVHSEGDKEIIIRDTNWLGNDTPGRIYPQYTQVNRYTNEGESEYTAFVLGLNGTLSGGHVIACNVTYGDKKNTADDFSPVLTNYPSDPADIAGEWGRARSDEEWRVVLSGVFRLPYNLTVAPIYQYGSGQPWNRRLGYDYNGDGRFGDRAPGVSRNSEDGPKYRTFNLRLTWALNLGEGDLDLIVEGFNLFDSTNYDVNSVNNAEFFAGPSLADPNAAYIPNPAFGTYSATLPPREIQIGLRYRF